MTREQIIENLEYLIQFLPGKGIYAGETLTCAIAALREKQQRERGCAYCVIGKRSPDAEYCSNCGRKLTPSLPELANESEEVNHD